MFLHIQFMSWIRIRTVPISPYGSGSDFYYTNPDPHQSVGYIRYKVCVNIEMWAISKGVELYPRLEKAMLVLPMRVETFWLRDQHLMKSSFFAPMLVWLFDDKQMVGSGCELFIWIRIRRTWQFFVKTNCSYCCILLEVLPTLSVQFVTLIIKMCSTALFPVEDYSMFHASVQSHEQHDCGGSLQRLCTVHICWSLNMCVNEHWTCMLMIISHVRSIVLYMNERTSVLCLERIIYKNAYATYT